jgi:lysophospholipase L1-like esterase
MGRLMALGLLGGNLQYYQQVKNYFGSSIYAYWLENEASGTVVQDISGNGLNAAYLKSPTLAAILAPSGHLAPVFSSQCISPFSAGLAAGFPYAEGAIAGFRKIDNVSGWSDSSTRIMSLYSRGIDGANDVKVYKTAAANTLQFIMHTGGSAKYIAATVNPTDAFFHFVASWNIAANRLTFWYNFAQSTQAVTGTFGAWAGALTTDRTYLGSLNNAIQYWNGGMSDDMVFSRELTQVDVNQLKVPSITKIAVIGDSIAATAAGWVTLLGNQYNNGANGIQNRAVGGSTILHNGTYPDMADQVTAAVNDDADVILVELGTNDLDTTDALRAEYQAQLNALKASNPSARIFGLGIFPRTNMTGVAAKNACILTACTNAGITYWDTTGWIDAATETTDGTHPTAGGHAKIATEVLARL